MQKDQCRESFRKIFKVPKTMSLLVEETSEKGEVSTQFVVGNGEDATTLSIAKPLGDITMEDINLLHDSALDYISKADPVRGAFLKFFGWWFIFAGALSVFSVCPICGQVGCPVGIGTTGILAGFFALLKQFSSKVIAGAKEVFHRMILS